MHSARFGLRCCKFTESLIILLQLTLDNTLVKVLCTKLVKIEFSWLFSTKNSLCTWCPFWLVNFLHVKFIKPSPPRVWILNMHWYANVEGHTLMSSGLWHPNHKDFLYELCIKCVSKMIRWRSESTISTFSGIQKIIFSVFVHTMKFSGLQINIGPYWLITKQSKDPYLKYLHGFDVTWPPIFTYQRFF